MWPSRCNRWVRRSESLVGCATSAPACVAEVPLELRAAAIAEERDVRMPPLPVVIAELRDMRAVALPMVALLPPSTTALRGGGTSANASLNKT